MNSLMDMLLHRRSIRIYNGDHIPDSTLEQILRAGLLSPSGRSRMPWEFIVVRDQAMLLRLAECRDGAAKMLAGADCAIVVLGDREKSDTIIEDCSIALAYMHLMADSLGVGSCWIQGRLRTASDGRTTEDYVRDLLGFPEQYQLEAILSLGIPKKAASPHNLETLSTEKLHYEAF